jgi:8-oxo-dGTP pyrophosphatase MutT (NUDIX family)
MRDDKGPDDKILAVAVSDEHYREVLRVEQLPHHLLVEIEHFFATYKHLEGKEVQSFGWEQAEFARAAVEKGAHPVSRDDGIGRDCPLKSPNEYTHRVAVSAYVVCEGEFLLLRRARSPELWAPPGGRLHTDEDPNLGVIRETREETGLSVTILGIVGIWYGDFGRGTYVSVDYLTETDRREVVLSAEHSEYRWASLEALKSGQPPLGVGSPSYSVRDFEKAWRLVSGMRNRAAEGGQIE